RLPQRLPQAVRLRARRCRLRRRPRSARSPAGRMTAEPPWLEDFLAAERLPSGYRDTIERVVRPLAERIAASPHPITVGICGTQASGKSTLVAALSRLLESMGLRTALLS